VRFHWEEDEKKEAPGGKRKKDGEGGVASRGRSPEGSSHPSAASRTWLAGGPAQDTQACILLEEEERRILQKTP
jgi:hypothetical protein